MPESLISPRNGVWQFLSLNLMVDWSAGTAMPLPPMKEIPTPMLVEYLRKLFKIGDTNNDGVLQPQEFAEVI